MKKSFTSKSNKSSFDSEISSKLFSRVNDGVKIAKIFSIIMGLTTAALLSIFSKSVTSIFNSNSDVINTVVLYILIVSTSFRFRGILKINSTILNVLNRPIQKSLLMFIQTFVLYISLAILGCNIFGVPGIFESFVISYLLGAILSHFTVKKYINTYENKVKSFLL